MLDKGAGELLTSDGVVVHIDSKEMCRRDEWKRGGFPYLTLPYLTLCFEMTPEMGLR